MTTIAWRDGILAADSRATNGDWMLPGVERKIFPLPNGVAAISGSLAEAFKLLHWVENGQKGPQPGGKVRVVVMTLDGSVRVYEDEYWYDEPGPFGAYGSGFPAALGAMHAGASAAEAVRCAGLVDPNSGGPVHWVCAADGTPPVIRVYQPSSSPQSRAEA